MLSEDQITRNKEQFISLLRGVTREGSNIEGLINKLCSSDFLLRLLPQSITGLLRVDFVDIV